MGGIGLGEGNRVAPLGLLGGQVHCDGEQQVLLAALHGEHGAVDQGQLVPFQGVAEEEEVRQRLVSGGLGEGDGDGIGVFPFQSDLGGIL